MYLWWVFFHVPAVFLFVLSHGAAAAVALTLRRQREPERIRALLEFSRSTLVVMYVSLLATLATGINVGFRGHWWGHELAVDLTRTPGYHCNVDVDPGFQLLQPGAWGGGHASKLQRGEECEPGATLPCLGAVRTE